MRNTVYTIALLAMLMLAGCSKSEAPAPQSNANPDSHPVKNVEALPSGTIREGAKTMNNAADLARTIEQQKQDREKNSENR
jgi:PBP1b-binding outer membrane lipoprotein LpoB